LTTITLAIIIFIVSITKGMDVNKGIKTAVKICGSQAVVAKACNVSQPTVFKWLNGTNMDVTHISHIIHATNFEVNPTELRPDVDWPTIYESLKQVFEGN
jgi:hypothetical protein